MPAAGKASESTRLPLSPAVRKRLQQWYESGNKSSQKGDFDYASSMFQQCVEGDPGNLIYAQAFLNNLYKKYNYNKKGSSMAALKGVAIRAGLKKAELQKDWRGVCRQGLEMLKINPWDAAALASLGMACGELGYDECGIAYLKAARDASPKDPQLLRLLARALERIGRFDDSIQCWQQVVSQVKNDEEAAKAIASLTVQRTLQKGGYEARAQSKDPREDAPLEPVAPIGVQRTPEQQLERLIQKDPANLQNYRRLVDLYLQLENFEKAEETLHRALEASGGEVSLREQLEDLQLRRAREQVAVAERKAHESKSEEDVQLAKRMKAELNRRETEVFSSRTERYPNNPIWKYELGLRLKRGGNYPEAIKLLQEARGDNRHRAAALVELGECFHQIQQYKLAMNNYREAIEAATDRDLETKKLALYRAGRLALGLKDLETADRYLTELAGIDYSYRDVASLLDKLARLRDNP